jgi:hypothetical protein
VILGWGIPVYAKEDVAKSSFRVDPAFIEIDTVRDPADKQVPIRYTNESGQPVRVELSFLPVTFASDNTGMTFPITKSILSSHIIPSADNFLVEPGMTKTILLSFTDLDLLTSADYYEALSAHISTQSIPDRKTGASVVANITTLVLVKNGGKDAYPIYAFEKGNDTFPPILFTYPEKLTFRISNKGRTYGIPRGLVTVTDIWGRIVYRGAVNTDSVRIFPGSIRLFDVKLLSEGFPLPMYLAQYKVDIYDAYAKGRGLLHEERSFLFLDPLFGILALVAAPLYVIFLVYASHVKKRRQAMDPAARPTGE